ncbi:MAG: hypothetical protein PHS37_04320 [Candidatus Omnitrophica bacterium]|nr:hypothetical protein [Candidatus Omnitrophota bacterium]
MKKCLLAVLTCMLALSVASLAYAADNPEAQAAPEASVAAEVPAAAPEAAPATEDNTEYGYGTVVSVDDAKKEIVISEYNWETDAEANVTYSVAPEAKFENVAGLKNITAGSYVDIEYLAGEGGKRVAKLISVYEPETEAEMAPESAPAAAPAAPAAAPAAPAPAAPAPAEPAK